MTEQYTYSQPSGIDFGRLTNEIRQEPLITVGLEFINYSNPIVDVFMSGVLTGAEVTALGNVVSGHVATPLEAKPQQFFSDLIPSGTCRHQIGQKDRRWDSLFATSGNFNTTCQGEHDSNTVLITHPSGAKKSALRVVDNGGENASVLIVRKDGTGNSLRVDSRTDETLGRFIQRGDANGLILEQEGDGIPLKFVNEAKSHGDVCFSEFDVDPTTKPERTFWYRKNNDQLPRLAYKGASGVMEVRNAEGYVTVFVDEAIDQTTFGTGFTAALWSSDSVRDKDYFSVNAARDAVAVWVDGVYKVTYTGAANQTSSESRTTAEWRFRVNGGNKKFGVAYSYHRNTTDGLNTATQTFMVNLDAGDEISLQARRITGGGILQFVEGTTMTVELVRM